MYSSYSCIYRANVTSFTRSSSKGLLFLCRAHNLSNESNISTVQVYIILLA